MSVYKTMQAVLSYLQNGINIAGSGAGLRAAAGLYDAGLES